MSHRISISSILAAALVLATTSQSPAQSNRLLRGAVEGLLNNAIQKETSGSRRQTTPNTATQTSTRESNRQVQQALNHFGYDVGTADGILGKRSRKGIARYQNSNGHKVTGKLTNAQRAELLAAWQRSTSSGSPVNAPALLGVLGAGQQLLQNRTNRTGQRRRGNTAAASGAVNSQGTVVTDTGTGAALTRRARRSNSAANSGGGSNLTGGQGVGAAIAAPVVGTTRTRTRTGGQAVVQTPVIVAPVQPAVQPNTATRTRTPPPASNNLPSRTRLIECRTKGISLALC